MLRDSRVKFDDCTFTDGQVGIGAIDCPMVEINECNFYRNRSRVLYGALYLVGSVATMEGCLLVGNWGAEGVVIAESCEALDIRSCTMAGNNSPQVLHLKKTTAALNQCILALNDCPEAITCDGVSTVTLHCTNIYGHGGDWVGCIADHAGRNGNFSADPLFCGANEFSISAASPCAPDHSGGCGLIGAQGVACGPQAIEPATWGRVKAIWR